MAQIHGDRYIPFGPSQSYNATTSVINFGTAPLTSTRMTCLALIFPEGSGENGFSWIWSRVDASKNGPRFMVEHNSGSPRLQCVCSSTGDASNPTQTSSANSVVYNKWNLVGFQWFGGIVSGGGGSVQPLVSVAGAPIKNDSGGGLNSNGTGSAATQPANSLRFGNSANGDRTMNGLIAYVAFWNRVLDVAELRYVQRKGPLVAPEGLTMCWANGRDYSPYGLKPSGAPTAISAGASPSNGIYARGLLRPYRRLMKASSSVTSANYRWFLTQ